MSSAERLHDPDRILVGTSQAIERARARGVEAIDPDDLLAGMLLAVARFGIVDLGSQAIDLGALGLRFDLPSPDLSLKPRYTPAAAAVFDRAARIARADGAARLAPIHLLVALDDPAIPTFAAIVRHCGLGPVGWRRLLAATPPPSAGPRPPAPAVADAGPAAAPVEALDALLTPEEAARAIGVHIQTVRGYIRGGKLAAFRVAGERAIRIRRDDLVALLEHLRVVPIAPGPPPARHGAGPSGRRDDR